MVQEPETEDASPQPEKHDRRHIQVVTEAQLRLRKLEAAQRAAHAAPKPVSPAPLQHHYAELQSPTMAARTR